MTKPVSRKLAVDCLLARFKQQTGVGLACSLCGQELLPGQNIHFDHIHAVVFDGPHEYMNLRPIHFHPCHKEKTARDNKDNAKVKRILDPKPSKRPMKSSGRKIPSGPFSGKGRPLRRPR